MDFFMILWFFFFSSMSSSFSFSIVFWIRLHNMFFVSFWERRHAFDDEA